MTVYWYETSRTGKTQRETDSFLGLGKMERQLRALGFLFKVMKWSIIDCADGYVTTYAEVLNLTLEMGELYVYVRYSSVKLLVNKSRGRMEVILILLDINT